MAADPMPEGLQAVLQNGVGLLQILAGEKLIGVLGPVTCGSAASLC